MTRLQQGAGHITSQTYPSRTREGIRTLPCSINFSLVKQSYASTDKQDHIHIPNLAFSSHSLCMKFSLWRKAWSTAVSFPTSPCISTRAIDSLLHYGEALQTIPSPQFLQCWRYDKQRFQSHIENRSVTVHIHREVFE